jgi:hypothetical protein
MRTIALSFVLVLLVGSAPSRADYEGPWCALSWGGDNLIENCSMRSFAMCLAEIRGTGGNTVCSPNPRSRAAAPMHDRQHYAR